MRSLIALAAFAVFSSLGWADDRPAGIPEEARYAKVDRVIDGDTGGPCAYPTLICG